MILVLILVKMPKNGYKMNRATRLGGAAGAALPKGGGADMCATVDNGLCGCARYISGVCVGWGGCGISLA